MYYIYIYIFQSTTGQRSILHAQPYCRSRVGATTGFAVVAKIYLARRPDLPAGRNFYLHRSGRKPGTLSPSRGRDGKGARNG